MNRIILSFLTLIFVSTTIIFGQETSLSFGVPENGILDDKATSLSYTFDGVAGSLIYIVAFSPDVYTGMRLYGTNGTTLVEVENNAIGSVIGPLELTNSGIYTLEVFRLEWDDRSGRIQTILDFADFTTIKPDGIYSGNLAYAGDIDFFRYFGTRDGRFGFSAEGNGITFGFNLPSGESFLTAGIDNFLAEPINILPEEGEYTGFIQTVDQNGTDYELRLQTVSLIDLTLDETIEGAFSEAEPAIFTFESPADMRLSIDTIVPNSNGNVWIEIFSGEDPYTVIEADYGSGPDYSPRIATLVTPFSGTYYVVLRANDYEFGNRDYTYSMTLGESTVTLLESGIPLSGSYAPESGSLIFNYRGNIDERIEIRLRLTSLQGQPAIHILSPDDELASFFTRSGTEVVFDLILPQNALYEIVIDDASYEGLPFEFELELRSSN